MEEGDRGTDMAVVKRQKQSIAVDAQKVLAVSRDENRNLGAGSGRKFQTSQPRLLRDVFPIP